MSYIETVTIKTEATPYDAGHIQTPELKTVQNIRGLRSLPNDQH